MKLTCWFDKYTANRANLPTSYHVAKIEEKKQNYS